VDTEQAMAIETKTILGILAAYILAIFWGEHHLFLWGNTGWKFDPISTRVDDQIQMIELQDEIKNGNDDGSITLSDAQSFQKLYREAVMLELRHPIRTSKKEMLFDLVPIED
jgi:hypothetical protein